MINSMNSKTEPLKTLWISFNIVNLEYTNDVCFKPIMKTISFGYYFREKDYCVYTRYTEYPNLLYYCFINYFLCNIKAVKEHV